MIPVSVEMSQYRHLPSRQVSTAVPLKLSCFPVSHLLYSEPRPDHGLAADVYVRTGQAFQHSTGN